MFKITKLKTWLTACCFLLVVLSQAQTQNPTWSLPSNYLLNLSPIPLPNGSASNQYPNLVYPSTGAFSNPAMTNQNAVGPHNMYSDASGNPLFSVVNGFLYNPHGYLVDTLMDTITTVSYAGSAGLATAYSPGYITKQMALGWSEICVVPVPGNCKQYYVFTAADASFNFYTYERCAYSSGTTGGGYRPYYALLDVSAQTPGAPSGELGKNITNTLGYAGGGHLADLYTSTNTPKTSYRNCSPYTGGIQYACTKLIGGSYRFLFVTNDQEITVYKITNSGITCIRNYDMSTLPSPGNEYFGTIVPGHNIAELECYVDSANNKIKVAIEGQSDGVYNRSGAALAFANFNMTTGWMDTTSFTNVCVNCSSTANGTLIKGVEFSPNGSYVYLINNYNGIAAYTWTTPGGVITPSPTIISTGSSSVSDFEHSQIELGKDGYLYFIGQSGTSTPRLAKLTSPNTPSSPGFVDNVVTLTGYSSTIKSMPEPDGGTSVTLYTDTIFFLPDQIDQEIYGSQFTGGTGQSCCLFYTPYDKQTYYAGTKYLPNWTTTATNQTWSANTSTGSANNPLALQTNLTSTVTIGEELRIPAGYTITINNMTIKFSPQARLIVENGYSSKNGGSLVLNNCTLKVDNRCGSDMWPGVQVWGAPAAAHTVANQGSLYLNNSQIQDAYNAVIVGYSSNWASTITLNPGAPSVNSSDTYLGTGFFYGGGGIIQATSTTFLNNQNGILMYAYALNSSPNNNVITKCSFLVNAALLASGVTPGDHIFMTSNTEGFYVVGTSFSDTHYLYNDYGIYAYNSNFAVGDYYGSNPKSTFTNMNYGIYALNSSGNTATMSCTRSIFNNNYNGIYLGYVNNAIVETDTFRIFDALHGANKYYGLYLDNSSGYYVQDNYFTKYSTGSRQLYGILVNNSGPSANAIFRNSFYSLNFGSQAQYRNYSAVGQNPNATGLLYMCNTFSSNSITTADIYVPALGSSANVVGYTGTDTASGICNTQGNVAGGTLNRYSADNQFSHTTGAHDFYIENGHALASYYTYYSASSGACGTTTPYFPVTINTAKVFPVCNYSIPVPDCSTGNTGHRTMYVNPITKAIWDAAAYKHEYDSLNALVDGGSTNDLMNLINGNNNAQAVYNSLNSVAPYLSNAVLKAYLNSNHSASNISQILTACSPLSNEVNNAVTASNLSTGIKNQISTIQTGSAKIDGLYNLISSAFTARHLSLDAAIRILIRTSAADSINMAKALMKEKAMELPPRAQVETGLNIHDSIMAANALAQVTNAEGQSNYVKLSNIFLHNMNVQPQVLLQNQSILNQVQTMAIDSSDRLTYLKANVLLQAIGKSKYVPYIQDDNITNTQGQTERTTQVEQIASAVISLSTLYNSPNPFKESTTVKAVIVEKTQNAFIVITDMVGNEVARYSVQQGENNINVSAGNLNQAVMFCTLVVDGVRIKTNKMVLIK